MIKNMIRRAVVPATLLVAGAVVGAGLLHVRDARAAAGGGKVFEIRTYYTHPGKLDALNARFRDNTIRLFEKHHIKSVGYWVPTDDPRAGTELVYIISHESRDQAKKNWDAFRADPEVRQVMQASEVNGKIVSKVESVYLEATDYSPLK
jgi:hypothetical protein